MNIRVRASEIYRNNNYFYFKGTIIQQLLVGYNRLDDVYLLIKLDKNERFFNKYKNNLTENGMIIIDNLEFHGMVGKSNEIKSRNLRQMVRKIEKFLLFLDNNTEYDVTYIEVGDRLGVCKKKK